MVWVWVTQYNEIYVIWAISYVAVITINWLLHFFSLTPKVPFYRLDQKNEHKFILHSVSQCQDGSSNYLNFGNKIIFQFARQNLTPKFVFSWNEQDLSSQPIVLKVLVVRLLDSLPCARPLTIFSRINWVDGLITKVWLDIMSKAWKRYSEKIVN